jgi:hypothetical protein
LGSAWRAVIIQSVEDLLLQTLGMPVDVQEESVVQGS